MASTSFALSNQIFGLKFCIIPPPRSPSLRHSLRIYAGCATGNGSASETASFYEVLGIQTGATCQEIKFAYRKLARVLHPDAAAGHGDDDASSADEFMRVHAAYATLSDPEKRAVYDRSLFRRPRRAAALTASGYSEVNWRRRTWETDQCW